jgi:putative endonuclease
MKKRYYVYAIKSRVDSRIYVGIGENPRRRLQNHNRGETRSTKGFRPWVIIYKRMIGSRATARLEEKKLKSGYGKEFLKSLNKHSAPR